MTAGAPAKLVLAPATGSTQVGSAVSYVATIQDANGNTVAGATTPIGFAVSGVSGTFNPASPVTPSGGSATSNFTPTSAPGNATITVTATGLTGATATLAVSSGSNPPQSLFTTQTPALPNASDGVPYELGMKFGLTRSGRITTIRYWKSPSDSGTHVGRIWSVGGTQLASVTFTGETASGWQAADAGAPLSVQANTTYIVSVNISTNYPFTVNGLATSIVNGDISSVADGRQRLVRIPVRIPSQLV